MRRIDRIIAKGLKVPWPAKSFHRSLLFLLAGFEP
jgi:hypothetical protein